MKVDNLFEKKATAHAKSCFFNSLLREWNGFSHQGHSLSIHLAENQSLLLPLEHFSLLGRHQYGEQIFLKSETGPKEISFSESVNLICTYLMEKFGSEPEKVERFKGRVMNSLQNTRTFLAFRKELAPFGLDFITGEQALLIGHNFHPTPKGRDQFNTEDLYRYSPELNGQFQLAWLLVDSSLLCQHSSKSFNARCWLTELAWDEQLSLDHPNHFVPVPMHPWQKRVLLQSSDIQEYIYKGRIRDWGQSTKIWHSTSSLRTVYREDASFMLKFSMSLRLTNSIRHLLFHEVERGQQLHDVLMTPKGQHFLSKHPTLKIVYEPAFIALKDPQGNPIIESIVVCRQNPFQGAIAKDKIVLATLTQDDPFGGMNLIQKMILSSHAHTNQSLATRAKFWFAAYLKTTVVPILSAHANYGIVLGAHQQNLVMDLRDGYPVGAVFRDCQGTGYTELGWSMFAKEVPHLNRANGNILSNHMACWLLSYYLILNSTFNVITALSQQNWIREEELISDLRNCLIGLLKQGVLDESCLHYLLHEEEGLMHKGNFLCSFKNMNENTIDDPLAIYTRVPNPFIPLQRELHA